MGERLRVDEAKIGQKERRPDRNKGIRRFDARDGRDYLRKGLNFGHRQTHMELIKNLHNELNLGYSGFAGEIPEELGSLHALERFRAGESPITGSIPLEIGNIHNVLNLSLHNNSLTDPSTIFNIPNLKELYLWSNELNGIIPDSISIASELTILELSSNSSSGRIPTTLVKASATNITTDQHALLALKDRIYDPTNLLAKNWSTSSSICTWIGVTCGVRHHRVTVLNISNFGLAGTIPPQLGNLSSLRVLDLSVNQLSGTIPSSIFQISSLERLNLSYNQLFDSFPSIIFNLPSLQVIQFGSNSLYGGLPSHIFNYLPNLKMLYLADNMFDGQIPSTISKCQQLQILSLYLNNFTGYIPKEIGNMTMLKELYLGSNELQGTISIA
ncbi:hypothetical protein LWI29_030788 [Acer saccharum]|uniref:Leucine-rich repeat-containing N-terminal plant-type domain-containing protein n=1 Tax=Acer saccharum TaxID=4024 RepID=A0AA39RRV8_ACESA|nr:hypothetical protein LWI29_030788 [Acer saccharum]